MSGFEGLSTDALHARSRSAELSVLPLILDRQVKAMPDKPLIIFDTGPTWTYQETRAVARGTAAALQQLGVTQGDRVLVWLPDGPDVVRLSLALSYIGAVFVPLNPEQRGDVLMGLIEYARAKLMIADGMLASALRGRRFTHLEQVVVLGAAPTLDVPTLPAEAIAPIPIEPKPPPRALQPWDVHAIFFTSGTTGVSKGVESTFAHCMTMAEDGLRDLRAEDRFVTPCGFFHVGGAYAPWAAIAAGASMVVVGKFSASRFWDQVNRHKATVALLIGVMCDFLLARPARPDDAKTTLRQVIVQPLPARYIEFARRFRVSIYTQFDQTETPPAITSPILDLNHPMDPGYCGHVRPGFDARIVDDNDIEVPHGQPGELVLRCEAPWILAPGYFDKPAQTAKAWRNGWYHTGDVFRRDAKGQFFFQDRSADVIRRRGENISSFDIESALTQHPDIAAAAAFGVPSAFGEDDIMSVIQLRAGSTLDERAVLADLKDRLALFMVPRYLRVMSELPRSATDKVAKHLLRSEGVTADTYDRDASARAKEPVE